MRRITVLVIITGACRRSSVFGGSVCAGGLPARHARQGLLRPQRRSGGRPADRSQADHRSVDADLRLYAGRGPCCLSARSGTASSSTWRRPPGKRSCSSLCNRTPRNIEAMRSGRLHVAGVNAGGNAIAVNCAGFVPFAMMARRTTASATRWKSSCRPTARSRRRPISRATRSRSPTPTSNSGFKAPSAILEGGLQSRGQARFRACVFR